MMLQRDLERNIKVKRDVFFLVTLWKQVKELEVMEFS